jgi:hypothetical protein
MEVLLLERRRAVPRDALSSEELNEEKEGALPTGRGQVYMDKQVKRQGNRGERGILHLLKTPAI